jgi:hypothetical protein
MGDQFGDDLAGFRGAILLGEGLRIDSGKRHVITGFQEEDRVAM